MKTEGNLEARVGIEPLSMIDTKQLADSKSALKITIRMIVRHLAQISTKAGVRGYALKDVPRSNNCHWSCFLNGEF